jgi:hypothetical protein
MTEVTIVDGEATYAPHQEATSYQVNPSPAAVNVGAISQGRTTSGSPVFGSAITKDSIVNVGGSETSVKAAIAAGLVQTNADGSFSVVSQAARVQAQQQQRQAQAEAQNLEIGPQEGVAPQVEDTIHTFASSVSPSTVMGAVLDFSNGQEVRDSHIHQAASEMGIEPSAVRSMVDQVRGAFETQARAVVDNCGLSSDEVFAWAYQNKPEMMKDAIHQQATMRTTKGYQKVAQTYMENLDTINPQALLNAQLGQGLKVMKANNGKIVIQTPKGQIEYRAAVRSGLIKLSTAKGTKR